MLNLGFIAFSAPWLLAALAALPALWWLLKVTPPAPRHQRFPAIALLFDVKEQEQTPHKTPLWLVILRMILAALVILALARPLLNPQTQLTGSGPLLLVVDDGWAAAGNWQARQRAMDAALGRAERAARPVMVLPTASPADGSPLAASKLMSAQDARSLVQAMQPKPWAVNRAAAREAADKLELPNGTASVLWLSDGLEASGQDNESRALAERLQRFGSLEVLRDPAGRLARALPPPTPDGALLVARVLRADAGGELPFVLRGTGEGGQTLLREESAFRDGERSHDVRLDLPTELRNRLTRLSIDGEESAGAVALLDERWRRRPVGVVAPQLAAGQAQPLLSAGFYLERALAPFSEVRLGPVSELLKRGLAVLALPDDAPMTEAEREQIKKWIEAGGTLLRFAGPRLVDKPDDLLPIVLRGGRSLGGAMSWAQPATLAPFAKDSPFFGLTTPPDVTIARQVLAEPALDLGEKTWAQLEDGTPLVTAEKRGQGRIVLVHTTATPEWSNLALSGLFVDLLRRVTALSSGVADGAGARALAPLQTLDGFGRLQSPPSNAAALSAEQVAQLGNLTQAGQTAQRIATSPAHPPGLYGNDSARVALNLAAGMTELKAMGPLPSGVIDGAYSESRERDLRPWFFALALLLAIADLWIGLGLRGLVPTPHWKRDVLRTRGAKAALALLILGGAALLALPAFAQNAPPSSANSINEGFALDASETTRLAFVQTGDSEVDRISRAGLLGLGLVLRNRTSVEPDAPMGVDIERDDLSFFPLLYWPMTNVQSAPSAAARDKLVAFLRNGGTILFDTRDQQYGGLNVQGSFAPSGPGAQKLRDILQGLDVPSLIPTPDDHILTKAFYLIQDFPGRWQGGQLWVEQSGSAANDGVASIIIGSNDWAGAWASNENLRPLLPVTPGGEQQREMAYRFGVNLVMYVLTGNYKADQVHVPSILERLGQ
ncbi:MAG TPA: DUF4159 domain-containing protein [Alphaproteobacteria bacterium]|nr:DUF4159 domain-containing protein [Alphaproteobacteria bacterium]